jgi:hypothetical protein
MEVSLHVFSTSAVDGSGKLQGFATYLRGEKTRYPLNRRLAVSVSEEGGEQRDFLPLSRIET